MLELVVLTLCTKVVHVMQAVLHAAWGLEPDTPCYRLDSLAPAQPCRRLGLQVLTDVAALRVRYIYVTRCRKRGLESILILFVSLLNV